MRYKVEYDGRYWLVYKETPVFQGGVPPTFTYTNRWIQIEHTYTTKESALYAVQIMMQPPTIIEKEKNENS